MVTKPRGAKKSFSTVPQSEITVGELISRVRPRLECAHKRGWDNWKDDNERPLNYDAGLSDANLLEALNRLRSRLTPFRPPHSGKSLQSPASRDARIKSVWTLPSNEFEEIAARLEMLFEYNGLHDAAAHWRHCEGRLTFEEVSQKIKLTGRDASALLAKLLEAARKGDVSTYAPGCDIRTAHGIQDEIYLPDLDTWLKDNERHFKLRFSAPEQQNPIRPPSRKDANRALLEDAIKACGGDLNNLPDERTRGKNGLRAKVRKYLDDEMSDAVFDSTMKNVRRAAKERAAAKK